MKIKFVFTILSIAITLVSCSKDNNEAPLSSGKDILTFKIDGVQTEIKDDKLLIYADTRETNFYFLPQITISEKATIAPALTAPMNFAQPVTFTVTAEDKSTKTYKTEVVRKEGLTEVEIVFTDFAGRKFPFPGYINDSKMTITVDFPADQYWSDNYSCRIYVESLGGLTTKPANGNQIFKDTKELVVTTPEGEKKYALLLQNTQNEIFSFELPVVSGTPKFFKFGALPAKYTGGLEEGDIIIFALENSKLDNITPLNVKISEGATSNPALDIARDFKTDVKYGITSESRATKTRTVRVIPQKLVIFNDNYPSYIPVTSLKLSFRYNAISKITKASLINSISWLEIESTINRNEFSNELNSYELGLDLRFKPATGATYYLKATLENGDEAASEAFFRIE